MQHKQLGVYIGTNYCGIPTVADDVTLISHDPMELQIMLNVQAEHANSKRYLVSQQKSSIVVMNGSQNYEWTFNNENLPVSESVTHLGIQRCSNITATSKKTIENRIITAKKTIFSLMGAGLHGLNGVNPKVSIHLLQTYVTPRLLYGLEILSLTLGDIRNPELYFKKLQKQIQHLSDLTANAATYLLLGRIPVEGVLHKRILITFGNIIRNINSVEKDIAFRQLALN
jgi:hypothetical protein